MCRVGVRLGVWETPNLPQSPCTSVFEGCWGISIVCFWFTHENAQEGLIILCEPHRLEKFIFRAFKIFLKTFGGNGIFSYFCGRITWFYHKSKFKIVARMNMMTKEAIRYRAVWWWSKELNLRIGRRIVPCRFVRSLRLRLEKRLRLSKVWKRTFTLHSACAFFDILLQ